MAQSGTQFDTWTAGIRACKQLNTGVIRGPDSALMISHNTVDHSRGCVAPATFRTIPLGGNWGQCGGPILSAFNQSLNLILTYEVTMLYELNSGRQHLIQPIVAAAVRRSLEAVLMCAGYDYLEFIG